MGFVPLPTPDGKALYANQCAACHGSLASSSKLNRTAAQIAASLVSQTEMRGIQLSNAEIVAIAAALAPLPPAGLTVAEMAQKYFGGAASVKSKRRVFRLTREQLDETAASLFPSFNRPLLKVAMPKDTLVANYEYQSNLGFNNSNFNPYIQWVDHIVAQVRLNPSAVINCTAENNSQACLSAKARDFIFRAFRGDVSADKLSEFSGFFLNSISQEGLPGATADLVDLVLSSPQFTFREEYDTSADSRLVPTEQLQFISYTLADRPPEALGLSSAQAQDLIAPGSRIARVDAVLNSAAARAKLSRFILAWLEVKDVNEYLVSRTIFPEFTNQVEASAVTEVKKFLNFHLTKPIPVLTDITKATSSFVDRNLESIYGVTAVDASGAQQTPLNSVERLGIFTMPAVVASHSGNDSTRLVHRGLFISRKIMCMTIGAVPPGASTQLPNIPGATERERIESVTSAPNCISCHATINPLGFYQENLASSGKWRTLDNGKAINASSFLQGLDEGTLNTTGPVQTLGVLTESARFKQCFVRNMFRYYIGREETVSDEPLLREMFMVFANGGQQDIVGALRVLVGSDWLVNK